MLKQTFQSDFSEKGKEVYYQIKADLEKKYNSEDVVLIEPESGDYFVGTDTVEAYKKAVKKYPQKKFFGATVGHLAFKLK